MASDSIIAEVRQVRDELAKRFNYDLRPSSRMPKNGRRLVDAK